MEKQELEILGSKGREFDGVRKKQRMRKMLEEVRVVKKELETRRRIVMERSRARGTTKRYQKIWEEFVDFCKWTEKDPRPAGTETVVDFLLWWDLSGRGLSVDTAVAAVRAAHLDSGWGNPCDAHAVRQVVVGIRKIAAEEGETREKRDPFPVEALRKWVMGRPEVVSEWR